MGHLHISNNMDTSTRDVEKQSDGEVDILTKPGAKNPDQGLTLEQFRALVGIPQEQESPAQQTYQRGQKQYVTTESGLRSISQLNLANQYPPPIRPSTIHIGPLSSHGPRALIFLRLLSRPSFPSRRRKGGNAPNNEAQEYATSLYYTLLREESDQFRLYHIYNFLVYACLIIQLVIASVLIILGALPTSATNDKHRIAIAVLGAVIGLHTGILSLFQGQGLPNRLLLYANRLQQVKTQIELYERTLRAGVPGTYVTFEDVVELWEQFETIRNEQAVNQPSVWAIANQIGPGGASFIKASRGAARAAEQALNDPVAPTSSKRTAAQQMHHDAEKSYLDTRTSSSRRASTRERGES